MYCVVELAGQQFKVQKGDKITVNRVSHDEGSNFDVDTVLLQFDADAKDVKIGTPVLSGAKVTFKVLENKRTDKVRVYKMHAKKRYRRNKSHRQSISVLEVVSVA
ncbi:50S ribosomal protein L21 [bacterium]|jgi:large subunit ribosomal protein L21|nr:50S ribosomal protein L21 [bacterium]